MKTKVKIPKNRLFPPVDFDEVLYSHLARGVKLSYTEYGFIALHGRVVIFDAFSAAHRFDPINAECGVVAFPFYCGCNTDEGERVAYCGLRFGDERAQKWKLLCSDEALGLLPVDPYAASVPISSGVCCIADEKTYAEYYSHIMDDIHPLAGQILLDGRTHTVSELYGKKVAVFSTGWGDGMYKSYVGLTADGRVSALIIDFGMIDYGPGDETPVEVEADVAEDLYVYDPAKSETENNIAKQTLILDKATDPAVRMDAFARRGYAYHSEMNIDAALADYLAAIDCGKRITNRRMLMRSLSVYENAAEIYGERSDYESAIRLMKEALEVGGGFYMSAYSRLIDLYILSKDSDSAREVAERMISQRGDDAVSYIKHGEACVAVMDYRAAAESFDILATRFELFDYFFDEASCYVELSEYDKAERVLDRHPFGDKYEQYWYNRAYIAFKRRDLTVACDCASRSYFIDPEYLPALYLLIDTQSLLQEYHAVASYAEEYKRLRPKHEYGYSVCAEAQLFLGNMAECARNYLYIYNNINKSDKYAALAAVVCSRAGEKKKARELLRMLRRKRSPYTYGVELCMSRHRYQLPDGGVGRAVSEAKDNEFLLTLAVFLFKDNDIVPATRIIGELIKSDYGSFDVIAMQIRIADFLGDKKQFLAFFGVYTDTYFSGEMTVPEKRMLAERFLAEPNKHRNWIAQVGTKQSEKENQEFIEYFKRERAERLKKIEEIKKKNKK